MELREPRLVIGKVAKTEGGRHKLERAAGNRQMQGIGFHRDGAMLPELRRRRAGASDARNRWRAPARLVAADAAATPSSYRPYRSRRPRYAPLAVTECDGSAVPYATTRAGRWIPTGHGSAGRSAARWSRTLPLRLRLHRVRRWCRRVARLASAYSSAGVQPALNCFEELGIGDVLHHAGLPDAIEQHEVAHSADALLVTRSSVQQAARSQAG